MWSKHNNNSYSLKNEKKIIHKRRHRIQTKTEATKVKLHIEQEYNMEFRKKNMI